MRIHQRVALGPVVVLLGIALGGCAAQTPGAPSPSPSASLSSSSAAPVEPAVTILRFSGSDVQALDDDGRPVESAPFGEGVEGAVALIADALGVEPTVTEQPQECAGAHTSYAWDGLAIAAWTGSTDFSLTIDAATSADVRLEAVGGFAVGDDVTSFVQTLPADRVASPGGSDVFVAFDVVSTTTVGAYTSPVGAVGYLPDGAVLESIITPGEWTSFLC